MGSLINLRFRLLEKLRVSDGAYYSPTGSPPPSFQLEFVHCFRLESRRKHTVSLYRAYSGNELKVTREGESIKPSDCSSFCELRRGSCCKVPNAQHRRLMLLNELEEKNGGQ